MSSGRPKIRGLNQPGDLGWVVMAHGELYAEEFGWNAEFEELVVQIVADYAREGDRSAGAAWIAEHDGRRVGCVFCVPDTEPTVAKLRLLLVDPAARGHRLGRRLVDTAIGFAGAAGYERVRLWTNHPLVAARRIYLDAGFILISGEQHHSFGVQLTGQVYERDLREPTVASALQVVEDREGGVNP